MNIQYSILLSVEADTPEGMEYGLEDGEIDTDEAEDRVQLSEQEEEDGEYDPLMAGNVEVFFVIRNCSNFCDSVKNVQILV